MVNNLNNRKLPWTVGTKSMGYWSLLKVQISSTTHLRLPQWLHARKHKRHVGAVAPDDLEELDDLDDDCGSDASNDLVYDIEQKIEDEAFRFPRMLCTLW